MQTGLISSNNTTVFYPLRPKPAVLALIFVIRRLTLGLAPAGRTLLSVCLHRWDFCGCLEGPEHLSSAYLWQCLGS